ncbi:hypothetical protein ACVW07_001016 [Cellulomonas sp. URHB0016]
MAEPSTDGAVAAAKYYLELYDFVFASGNLDLWRAMSADDCKFCNGVITDIEDMVALRHTSPSTSMQVTRANATEVLPQESYGVDLDVIQGAWTEIDVTGTVVDSGEPSSAQMYFALGWTEDGWLVRQVDVHDLPAAQ